MDIEDALKLKMMCKRTVQAEIDFALIQLQSATLKKIESALLRSRKAHMEFA